MHLLKMAAAEEVKLEPHRAQGLQPRTYPEAADYSHGTACETQGYSHGIPS